MPVNKNAYFRYILIDRCLTRKNKKYQALEDIIDYLYENLQDRISLRTLQDDIYQMRYSDVLGYYAPIEYSKINKGYYYVDANFSIGKFVKLTEEDYKAIQFAGNILDQYRNVGFIANFNEAVDKINSSIKVSTYLLKNNPENNSKVLYPETATFVKGLDLLEPLANAILEKKKVKVFYKRFQNESEVEHTVNPASLKEFNKRWYLIGHEDQDKTVLQLALDRIDSIETLEDSSRVIEFDTEKYFSNYYGVTVNPSLEPQEIEIEFSKLKASYLNTRAIHQSQKVIHASEEKCTIGFYLVPNYEFMSFLLSCAGEIKILKPESLNRQYIDRLKKGIV